MTTMTVQDVCQYAYPGQQALGNIDFGKPLDAPLFISKWTVPNEPKPSIADLEAMIPDYQQEFDFNYFIQYGTPLIAGFVDNVASAKGYDSAVSCASYVESTVDQWRNEALVFVAWRDSVYSYAIAQEALMQSGGRSVPTFEEFRNELPVIIWP